MTTARDVMTEGVVTVDQDASLTEAARYMLKDDIGDVLVRKDGELCGIVTDRDIVVRAIAEGRDPDEVRVGDVCTHELRTAAPDEDLGTIIDRMREHAIRRIPVVQDGDAVGMIAMGDLAVQLDRDSLLADISAQPGDHTT